EGPLPLTPVQRRFFEDTTLDPHHFNHAFLLEVHNPLEARLLKAAVRRIVSHHDALRMRFERDAYGWHQTNANLDEFPVDHVFLYRDFTASPESDQTRLIEAQSAELQAGLNLSTGPLLRVVLFDLGPDRPNRLLIIIHHLIVDGVSWRILMSDL